MGLILEVDSLSKPFFMDILIKDSLRRWDSLTFTHFFLWCKRGGVPREPPLVGCCYFVPTRTDECKIYIYKGVSFKLCVYIYTRLICVIVF